MSLWIDLMRHILSVAVIIQHMPSHSRYSTETSKLLELAIDWIDGAVAGFFILSGYLCRVDVSIARYVKRQFFKLIVPYVLFSSAYALTIPLLTKTTQVKIDYLFFIYPGAGMQLYFLPLLFITSVSVFLAHKAFSRSSKATSGAILIIGVIASLMFATDVSTGPQPRLLAFYISAFVLGELCQSERFGPYRMGLIFIPLGLLIGNIDKRLLDLVGILTLFIVMYSLRDIIPAGRFSGSGGVYLLHTPISNFSISTILYQLGVVELYNIIVSVILTYVICLAITKILISTMPSRKWLFLE